jgi:clan AA aspartic protease
MGYVHAEIELINGEDRAWSRKKIISEGEIKRINIMALVDTGSIMLSINENIQEYLKAPVIKQTHFETADGNVILCPVVDMIYVRFKNRETLCQAVVLPGSSEPLLGAIPLEGMDVLIHPKRQELIVHPDHPDGARFRI